MASLHIPSRCGTLVDVDGRRVCARRAGSGGPTVVFENGAGTPSYEWASVQDDLAAITTTVAYDRAGIGWSDPSPRPRIPAVVNDELLQLLTTLDASPPWILVGHSLGGLYALSFAARHRDQVAGLVLVDAAHPHVYEQVRPERTLRMRVRQKLQGPLMSLADRVGLLAPIARRQPEPWPEGNARPSGLTEAREAFWRGRNRLGGTRAEAKSLPATTAQLLGLDLGDLPIAVVSAGRPDPGFAPIWNIWQAAQADLLGLSTNSVHVVAHNSGHLVPLTEPEVVSSAIRAMIGHAPPTT